LCALITAPASAQELIKPLVRPAPDTIKIPNLGSVPDADDVRAYDRYFVFWKPSVSYEMAFSDLEQCRLYGLETKIFSVPPNYVPLGGEELKISEGVGDSVGIFYGIVGGLMADYFIDRTKEELYHQSENRCMSYKGYMRFGVSREAWTQVMAGKDSEVAGRRALIAAGSKPDSKIVDP